MKMKAFTGKNGYNHFKKFCNEHIIINYFEDNLRGTENYRNVVYYEE